MARTFNGSTQQGTSDDTGLPSGTSPCTLFAHAKVPAVASGYPVIFGYGQRNFTTWRGIGIAASDGHTGKLYASQYGSAIFSSGSDMDDDAWHRVSCDFKGSTDAQNLYQDGVSVATGTMAISTTLIGASGVTFGSSGGGDYLAFDGAEFAIWSAVLDASEHAALGKGFSPLLIRPASLVRYWKFLGNDSPEIPTKGAYTVSLANSPAKASQPRVIYPRRKQVVVASAAAPSTTVARLVNKGLVGSGLVGRGRLVG